MFTDSEIWKVQVNETIEPLVERLQSTVGAVSRGNIVATEQGVFFLARDGIYFTDGNTVQQCNRIKRKFDENVRFSRALFPLTAGGFDPVNNEVRIGVPYSETRLQSTTQIDGEFVFNFNLTSITSETLNRGWSRNSNIFSSVWLAVDQQLYFGDQFGAVNKIREDATIVKWSDGAQAIPMRIDTRHMFFGAESSKDYLREYILELGAEFDTVVSTSYAFDYRYVYDSITTHTVDASALAVEEIGDRYSLSARWADIKRNTTGIQRQVRYSLRIADNTLQSSGQVYTINLVGTEQSTKGSGQRSLM